MRINHVIKTLVHKIGVRTTNRKLPASAGSACSYSSILVVLSHTPGYQMLCTAAHEPSVRSGVVRLEPLHLLAGGRTKRLNQALSVLYFVFCFILCFIVLLFIMAHFYVLLVFVGMCSVFWLFWLSFSTCQVIG